MKKNIVMLLLSGLFTLIFIADLFAEKQSSAGFPKGMSGQFETVTGIIKKVYSAETETGARYRAYVVDWQDTEIVLQDILGTSEKKLGESITYIVQVIEVENGEDQVNLLQFSFIDFN